MAKPHIDVVFKPQASAPQTPAPGEDPIYDTGPLGGSDTETEDYLGLEAEGDPSPEPVVVETDTAAHAEVSELGYLGMELGPINEFTELRRARLAEEQVYLEAQIDRLDAQIVHLHKRRDDAMRGLEGITADLTTLDHP